MSNSQQISDNPVKKPFARIYNPNPNSFVDKPTLNCYLNAKAMDMLGTYEVEFDLKTLSIKETNVDSNKIFKINKKARFFCFNKEDLEYSQLIGHYKFIKVCDGEFVLKPIKPITS